jgi:hypothetical protein
MTAPTGFEMKPMTWSEQQWWDEYCKARATTGRCYIVDRGNDAPTRPLVSPRMVEILYGGWELEPDPRFGR